MCWIAAGAVAVSHFVTTFLASPSAYCFRFRGSRVALIISTFVNGTDASQLMQSLVAIAAIGALVGLYVQQPPY